MPIPLLEYPPVSNNVRVQGFEGPADSEPRIFTTDNLLSAREIETLIDAAYRQIFHEQQMVAFNRQPVLETQLKLGQITVKDFIRGLALSDSFRRLNYEANNNYRFAEICVQRILGRQVYGEREKIAWSIVIATKGVKGFIDDLVNSEEYMTSFGESIVPYQRKRKLRHRPEGEISFEHMARYDADYRDRMRLAQKSRIPKLNKFEPIIFDLRDPSTRQIVIIVSVIIVALLIIWFSAGSLDYR